VNKEEEVILLNTVIAEWRKNITTRSLILSVV
jgi:hypothetical protein